MEIFKPHPKVATASPDHHLSILSGKKVSRRDLLRWFGFGAAGLAGLPLIDCGGTADLPQKSLIPKDDLESFAQTLPKQVGGTTWTGNWKLVPGATGAAFIEGYYDQNGRFKHKILSIEVPTVTNSGQPLTLEQQLALFKKEASYLYSVEYIDIVLSSQIDINAYPAEEIRVLLDGLATLRLSPEEQKLVGLDYSNFKYNYYPEGHSKAGLPYYPDPAAPLESVLHSGEYVQWDGKTPSLKSLAAIDIMSTRERVISTDGLKSLGPALLKLAQANPR